MDSVHSDCSCRGHPLVIEVWERNVLSGFRVHSSIPREACFDQADVKVEKDIMTFNEEKGEDTLVEEGHQVERVTVIFKNPCCCEVHQRNIRGKTQ